jgi:hypothetical protein
MDDHHVSHVKKPRCVIYRHVVGGEVGRRNDSTKAEANTLAGHARVTLSLQ